MNNKKLSKLLLGSALILGLGASTGSFSQQQAQIIVGEAATALISESASLRSAAQAIAGPIVGTATAAQLAAIQSAVNTPGNAQGAAFAALLKQEETTGESVFHRSGMSSASLRNRLRQGGMALILAAGLSQADAQAFGTGIASPVAKAVIGNSALDCIGGNASNPKGWTNDNAKAVAGNVLVVATTAKSVPEFQQKAVEKSMALFPGESFAQVQQRLSDSMNSPECDIARVKGLRPARPIN